MFGIVTTSLNHINYVYFYQSSDNTQTQIIMYDIMYYYSFVVVKYFTYKHIMTFGGSFNLTSHYSAKFQSASFLSLLKCASFTMQNVRFSHWPQQSYMMSLKISFINTVLGTMLCISLIVSTVLGTKLSRD